MSGFVFSAVREGFSQGEHVLSACLFREPEWVRRFPGRRFEEKYLSASEDVRVFLEASGWSLVLFVDAAMLPVAMRLAEHVGRVDVYLVRSKPRFAFEQHLWRYLAVMLPGAEERVWHFRGMDDLVPCELWRDLAGQLVSEGCDVLHAPCRQAAGRLYVPVRGKCSMRAGGVVSFRRWWGNHAGKDWRGDHWANRWHADEMVLAEWFEGAHEGLGVVTVKNRWLGPAFDAFLRERRGMVGKTVVVNTRLEGVSDDGE